MPRTPLSPRSGEPLVLGLLGGVASGKSEVARRLAGGAGLVLSADALARELLASDELRAPLLERFGPASVGPDGRPDREFLAARIFTDDAARAALEELVHPRVRERIHGELEAARRAGVARVVLDVPLLLENNSRHGLADLCDLLVFVDVSEGERERRATELRGWAPGEVARREAAQTPLAEKRARADRVVPNEGTLAELDRAVRELLDDLGLD